jgi:polysaccharide biosynthesis transport protein
MTEQTMTPAKIDQTQVAILEPTPLIGRRVPAPPTAWMAGAGAAHELLDVLVRRWRTVLLTVGVVVGIAAAYCFLATPWYLGSTTVLIEARTPQLLTNQRFGDEQDPFTSAKYDYYQTQFTLLGSATLASRVINELGLARDPRFLVPGDVPRPGDPVFDGKIVKLYLKQLVVLPIRGTRLVTIQFYARDPVLAADIANTHARLFVRSGLERLDQSMDRIRTFLRGKSEELQERLQTAEVRLLAYEEKHKLLPANLAQGVASDRLTDLGHRLTAAEGERIVLEAQHDLIRRGDAALLPAVLSSPLIQNLRDNLNRLEVDYALTAQKFRPSYPPLRQLAGQLDGARKLLKQETAKVVGSVETSYVAAQRTVDELQKRLEQERSALLKGKDNEGELLRLTRDVDTTRALYENVLARVKELDVSGGADASNVSIAEAALPPQLPSSPAKVFDLALSLVTGLVLGTGLAFLREFWRPAVCNAVDVRRVTGLPTLAVVPDFAGPPLGSPPERLRWHATRVRGAMVAARLRLLGGDGGTPLAAPVVANGTFSPFAEAFQTLRASLLLSRGNAPAQVMLITSAAAQEGKTTTAVNTAVALAHCGANVLLVDGDFRMPSCHHLLGATLEPGLGDYLAGRIAAPPIQTTSRDNLSFVSAGRSKGSPSKLFSSAQLDVFFSVVRDRFDFVIVDSPPVLVVSDGLLLASHADGVILVTESHTSAPNRVSLALERLERVNAVVLGAVLNRGDIGEEYYPNRYGRPSNNGADTSEPPAADQLAPGIA